MSPLRLPTLLLAVALCSLAPIASAQVHATEAPAPKPAEPAPTPADRGVPAAPAAPAAAASALSQAHVFAFADMPVRQTPAGGESRSITRGTLLTGETVALHESTQPASATPVPLHVIHHTEFICVQEGTVAFDHQDASGNTITEQAGPGSVIYVANGTNHRLRNVGTTPARYTVVGIGGDAR